MALNRLALDAGLFRGLSAVEIDALMLRLNGVSVSEGDSEGQRHPARRGHLASSVEHLPALRKIRAGD